MKHLIIIGGGILQIPLIKQAYEMDFIPIVFDYNPSAPAFSLPFVKKFLISTLDPEMAVETAVKLSKKFSINGVLTVGTDASYTCAVIADKLNLIQVSPEVALNSTNKILMRTAFKEHGISQPEFYKISTWTQLNEIYLKMKNNKIFKNGAVIKPADNMGAKGVVYISKEITAEKLKKIYEKSLSYSKVKNLIIEEYIEAHELSIDALIIDGKIHITGVADRFIQKPPYFVELGHFMPSLKNKKILDIGIDIFKKGIKALGINIGAAKGDIRVKINENKAFVGEIASRLSGGFMSAYTFPYSTGINLMKNIIKIHTGDFNIDINKKWELFSCEMGILPAKKGIYYGIKGLNDAMYIKEVKNIFIYREIGEPVDIPINNVMKIGNIITVSDTAQKAIESAKKALKILKPIIM